MSLFQIVLLIISVVVLYIFFKQLFSGSYPKRGIDFEAKREDEYIGTITQIDKNMKNPPAKLTRVQELNLIAENALESGDYQEADKALSSALILDKNNREILLKYGHTLIALNRLDEAKEIYERIISIYPDEDLAYGSLANILHKLGDTSKAIEKHKRAIELDGNYAPHYFNYANTLHDIGRRDEALENYKRAYRVDSKLKEAKEMVDKLS
ncbi:MAG: tetratricopeptide repeat protein [Epsilonproteobacteria bacterium]|nr:tetratricopeptide repeat protein [Campylobacterota bacterium]